MSNINLATISRVLIHAMLVILIATSCSSPRENTTQTNNERASNAQVQYLANTGLLVTNGPTKILFDPLFKNGFDTYHLVPDEVRATLLSGQAPFDGIDAIFISHSHGDHFDGADINHYLTAHSDVVLVAPPQAIETMRTATGWSSQLLSRIKIVELELGQDPSVLTIGEINATIVRVPHAGWPRRMTDVQNMIYRVDLGDGVVMHMGDADPNHQHFNPYQDHWNSLKTNIAFPPYWFFGSRDGDGILNETLNIDRAIGVHVPISVPTELKATGADYFSEPGETREIHQH